MKKYLMGLVAVVLLVLALPAIASASPAPRTSPSGVTIMWTGKRLIVRHTRATRPVARAASAYDCIAPGDTTVTMIYVKAGGGPGGGNTYAAWGKQSCGGTSNYYQELQVCMAQLITGGWSVINWSCQTVGPATANSVSTPSHWVGLTKGRWYCPYLWQWVQGPQYTYGFWPGSGVQG